MKFNKVIFMKRNNELVGVGIKPNGAKELLTLEEAIKYASVLKKESKYAVEFLNTKEKVNKFNNKKQKKLFNPKRLLLTPLGVAVVALGIKGYALINKSVDVKALNPKATKTLELTNEENATQTFDDLLSASTSVTQREFVQMMADYIEYFNIDFANNYVEVVDGVEVKPALSWEYEVPALTIAFNDLSKNDLTQIFNGIELDADELDASYKNAILQLMGAYTISDSENPVRIYDLIADPEAKAYVEDYEALFYEIKNANTKEERVELIQKFFDKLFKDYPITAEVREYGISHAESRDLMNGKPEKQAIIPMIAAIEISYQNEMVDVTLTDEQIEYLNDLGMCNEAYDAFEKAETVTMLADKNDDYADYKKLSELLIKFLINKNAYVISDENRDLSQLTVFDEIVNKGFDPDAINPGDVDLSAVPGTTTTKTTTKRIKVAEWVKKSVKTRKETKTTKTDDRKKAVEKAGEEKVKEAENKEKERIEKENKENKEKAEKEAETKQKEEQAKADKDRKEKEKQAQESNKQVDDTINDMNNTINENNKDHDKTNDKPVNTNGNSNVNINKEHTDSNGNLNDSVKDITKEGSDHKLPDPEDTGKEFDAKANTKTSSKASSSGKAAQAVPANTSSEPAKQEVKQEETKPVEVKKEESKSSAPANLPDPEETGKEFDAKANEMMSKEALVDYLLQRLSTPKTNTKAKVLVRR